MFHKRKFKENVQREIDFNDDRESLEEWSLTKKGKGN